MIENKNEKPRAATLGTKPSHFIDIKKQFSLSDCKAIGETNQSENWSGQDSSDPPCEYDASTIESAQHSGVCLETDGSNAFSKVSQAIQSDAIAILGSNPKRQHSQVFQDILNNLSEVDFRAFADIPSDRPVPQKVQIVVVIQEVLNTARNLNCRLCRKGDFIYVYNGEFWQTVEESELESFLGEAAERLGVGWTDAKYHRMRGELVKQFFVDANLPTAPKRDEEVLINLKSGTFVFSETDPKQRDFRAEDFLTYQLPFEYDPNAEFPRWQAFLDEVIPDKLRQVILAQYVGYVFARHLKLEKTLILYGSGANGKSVVFDVIRALLGEENVSEVSLEAITTSEYFRSMLADKLLNYSSEISNRIQTDSFKKLTSGEPIHARLPYGQPMLLRDYARLAFNANDLPVDVEHSEAFFRRFLIIPFDITIPAHKRDPLLAKKIIENELSGVFNWVLTGLRSLLENNSFSSCEASDRLLDSFRLESDSVAIFLEEEGYRKSLENQIRLKDLYRGYREYCIENGYRPLSQKKMSKRLSYLDYVTEKHSVGKVVYLKR